MTFSLLWPPVLAALLACATDLARFRIPNALTLGTALLFFPVALALGMDADSLLRHLEVGGVLLGFGFLFFLFRIWGGGDAKLFAALGLWLDWPQVLPFIFVTVMAGGVLALIVLVLRRLPLSERVRRHPLLRRLLGTKSAMPYGVAIAVGMIWVALHA